MHARSADVPGADGSRSLKSDPSVARVAFQAEQAAGIHEAGDPQAVSVPPSGIIDRWIFKLLLASLGLGFEVVCKIVPRFRAQITRDLVVQVGSADGVAHHYSFTPRQVKSSLGAAVDPPLSVTFANARQGWTALSHRHAIGKIVQALLTGGATYNGNGSLFLWFYGLTRMVLPIFRQGPLSGPLPFSFLAPDPQSAIASRTIYEPVALELDPAWTNARRQRDKMVLARGSRGELFPTVF